jgi:homoserine kinase
MAKTVKVRVPGTTANCGPCFDAAGIACNIYNELELTLIEEDKIILAVEGEGKGAIEANKKNIVWQSIEMVLKRTGNEQYKGAKLTMLNRVPLSRGLGSSAAAIVAGLAAANAALDSPLTKQDILDMATEIEGHPDNVAPAIFGGMTVSVVEGGKARTLRIMPKLDLKLVVAIPGFNLSTKKAREVLPDMVTRQDAVFNLAHAALLTGAMCMGDAAMLKAALKDRLHQPYRLKLITGMEEVLAAACAKGALGAVLSGAGPCLIAFALENEAAIGEAMVEAFKKNGIESSYKIFTIDTEGVKVI